jgi:hypothetical protein
VKTSTHTAWLALALAIAAAAPAAAQTPKSGSVYYVNRTTAEVKLLGQSYTDSTGRSVSTEGNSWKVKPGQGGYVMLDGRRVVARRFEYTLETADGRSGWFATATALDKDGYFVIELTADNLAQHRRLTGAAIAAAPAGARPRQPDADAVGRAIVKILGAGVADAISQPDKEDGFFETILRQAARRGRDELIESAVKDVFPDLKAAEAQSVRRVICLGLDGQLNQRNWAAATAKDDLMARLRRDNPDLASAAEVADFIAKVMESRR